MAPSIGGSQVSYQEEENFNELWQRFKEKPFTLSLKQTIILLDNLHRQQLLAEPIADDILRCIKVNDDFYAQLESQTKHESPPKRRLELWKAPDTTTLAAVAWAPGAITHIHDHSHFGLTRTLKGSVTSLGFKYVNATTLEYLGRVHFERNRVYHVPIGDVFIHAVGNLKNENSYELHFYGPSIEGKQSYRYDPINCDNILDLSDGAQLKVNCWVDPEQIEDRFN